jgi:rhodanese-related sulfurtransferase
VLKRCPENAPVLDGHCFSASKRRTRDESDELSLSFGKKNHSEVISQTLSTMTTEGNSGGMECEGTSGTPQKLLQTSKNLRNPGLNAITASTLVGFMNNSQGMNYMVIDCRYDYEYHGGHIPGAIHIDSPSLLETLLITYRRYLFNSNSLEYIKENFSLLQSQPHLLHSIPIDHMNQSAPILIFHCEFSQKRGPRALRMLREIDRQLNYNTWPNLYYPEVYILEGGYSAFHRQYPQYTNPQNSYIKMVDETYRTHYCQAREKEKRTWEVKSSSFGKVLKRSKTINDF